MEREARSDPARGRRRRLVGAVKLALRELRIQLSVLNHQVGERLDLRDIDLHCLDLLARSGPLSPSRLARHAGVHPATMTGVLDRLERSGWVVRERAAADRRVVVVRVLHGRTGELAGLYAGMNAALDTLCGAYDDAALELLAEFLQRVSHAGEHASADLGDVQH